MNYDLKENIKGFVNFQYYRESALWYKTETGMIFPVPISDIGDTMFNDREKAMLLMRWIRKFIAEAQTAGDQ